MSHQLRLSIGQYSDKGRKETNQDFHGAYFPTAPLLTTKGVALAIADGISSSNVSRIASEAAVRGFMEDYYCTSEAWSVKTSAQRVLLATNSWLFSQTQQSQHRYEKDRGYVCTLSALIIKSTTAHLFHVGDARIYRLRGTELEQLTDDHRLWVSPEKSYLSRALGISQQLDIDYQALPLETGDIYFLSTDGVYEHVSTEHLIDTARTHADDLDTACKVLVQQAFANGSDDNLTLTIVRIDGLPELDVQELYQKLTELPFPPLLEARMHFDGYKIIREMHASHRSHVYLALDEETNTRVILKTPSIDMRDDPGYLDQFLMEEWIARRINSPHVVKSYPSTRERHYIYIVMEYIEGQTLAQWMIDNPKPSLESVRNIVEQVARGLQAFHRQEMLHQDLRPQNVMIDTTGSVKIIDFGSALVAGIAEIATPLNRHPVQGTMQYTAPEYFMGEAGSPHSDLFSLGVITYQMLTGRLPYGAALARARTRAAQHKLRYDSALDEQREIPAWIDDVLKKAVNLNRYKRYEEISEFVYDLRHPNKEFLNKTRPPLLERNPVFFWKGVSFLLAIIILLLLSR